MPKIVSINVNPKGGVPKHAVDSAFISTDIVVGDKQRNLKVHGGPMRAVCLYSIERIKALNDEGHPIRPGDVGENLTVEGLDWDNVLPGVRLRIGDNVELEITDYTIPCANIAFAFCDGKSTRIGHKNHPGWARMYAKVLKEGEVRVGDEIAV